MHQTSPQLHILHRLSALVLCLLLMLTLLPTAAYAASGTTGELRWQLSGGTLTVSGSGPMPDYTDANMPPWYDSAQAINRIVVRQGVTSVGSLAFYGCSTATGVSLPASVTSIGDRAFKNCSSLTYLGFPAGLTAIGEAAFESCTKLNGILLPTGLQTLGSYAFNRCTSLSHITIPATVTEFGMVTFAYCTGLTQAVILCPVEKLPDWTFYGCTALSAVSLPETVAQTGDLAFHDCENLGSVYYSGAASQAISDALAQEEATRYAVILENTQSPVQTGGSSSFNAQTGTGTMTNVTTSENVTITKTQESEYSYTVNGQPATLEEVLTSAEDDTIEAEGTTSTTISATVQNPEGWQEVIEQAEQTLNRQDPAAPQLEVKVQLPGSEVAGEDLSALAGKDVELTVTTGSGGTWVIDQSEQSKNSFQNDSYDLELTVEKLEENHTSIESDTVYQLQFSSDIDFKTTVGVNVKVGNAYQYATLYQKNTSKLEQLQTVMVDEGGNAWFSIAQASQKTEYYVGINVEGVDTADAVIPASLQQAHGIDSTLMDASGTQYVITGRTSRWGITGGQFALMAAAVIGAMVLVVSLVMITMNRIARSKEKYRIPEPEDEAIVLDEEAIRLQVMREMLEQADAQKPAPPKDEGK